MRYLMVKMAKLHWVRQLMAKMARLCLSRSMLGLGTASWEVRPFDAVAV